MAGIKGTLQLRTAQTQTLAMTPQMQQAIRLLQLSTLELSQEIRQTVDLNPLLEMDESQNSAQVESLETLAEQENDSHDYDPFDNDSSIHVSEIESDGRSLHLDAPSASDAATPRGENPTDIRARRSLSVDQDSVYEGETSETLYDHLMWQLNLSPLQGRDRAIAEAIIDGIDDSGYLRESLDDILAAASQLYPELTMDEVDAVLKLVQRYDPPGVGARGVQECILLQLRELPPDTPGREVALSMAEDYFHLLSVRDYRTLRQRLSISEDELKEAGGLIKSLNPRPGHFAIREKADFVIPDVVVFRNKDGSYGVELNQRAMPSVRLNEKYCSLAEHAATERDRQFFKSHQQEANFFLKSIEQRNTTLLKVSECIVRHQQDFMEHGESCMHPMVLKSVAEEIDMHESTISRITTEKYMHTPRGTFELKYFFSSSVTTDDGGAASSTAIRAHIKEQIARENTRKPLSDSQLVEILKQKGFVVARRTVAKYRESLGIAPSSQRKELS